MKKYIFPIFLSLLVGILTTKFMFNQYTDKQTLKSVFNDGENLFFIQQGIYSSVESIKQNVKGFNNYIYTLLNDKYYVFIAITKSEDVMKKIQDFYKQKGYITYVKEFSVKNSDFLSIIENYDTVLLETDDDIVIENIINKVIEKYKELVIDDG